MPWIQHQAGTFQRPSSCGWYYRPGCEKWVSNVAPPSRTPFETQSEIRRKHTVVVAIIFSNRWSNWEISLFMRTVPYELSFGTVFHVMKREGLRRCVARQYVQCNAFEVGCDSILFVCRLWPSLLKRWNGNGMWDETAGWMRWFIAGITKSVESKGWQ